MFGVCGWHGRYTVEWATPPMAPGYSAEAGHLARLCLSKVGEEIGGGLGVRDKRSLRPGPRRPAWPAWPARPARLASDSKVRADTGGGWGVLKLCFRGVLVCASVVSLCARVRSRACATAAGGVGPAGGVERGQRGQPSRLASLHRRPPHSRPHHCRRLG